MKNDPIVFPLRGEFIALNSLLKASGLVSSGAEASRLIVEENVKVDGIVETRKNKKIRVGQQVESSGQRITIVPE